MVSQGETVWLRAPHIIGHGVENHFCSFPRKEQKKQLGFDNLPEEGVWFLSA
jgi:hypothetical protein